MARSSYPNPSATPISPSLRGPHTPPHAAATRTPRDSVLIVGPLLPNTLSTIWSGAKTATTSSLRALTGKYMSAGDRRADVCVCVCVCVMTSSTHPPLLSHRLRSGVVEFTVPKMQKETRLVKRQAMRRIQHFLRESVEKGAQVGAAIDRPCGMCLVSCVFCMSYRGGSSCVLHRYILTYLPLPLPLSHKPLPLLLSLLLLIL